MKDRKKRGKPSKIDLLPSAIKSKLDELLRNNKMQQKDILKEVNLLIADAGLDKSKLSASGLCRYSTQFETAGAEIRAMRETTEMWINKFGSMPTGDVTQLLMEMLRSQYFKLMMKANEKPEEVLDAKTIGNLALSIQRLERAALLSIEKEKEIKKAYAEEIGKNIDKTAQARGLTKDEAQFWREQVLGVTSEAS
jgi:Bacteriophage Mu, Gp27